MSDERTIVTVKVTSLEVDQLHRRVMLRLGQLDITLDEVAARMGVSRPRVSLIIHSAEITRDAFDRLSAALGVDDRWWQQPIGLNIQRDPGRFAGVLRARARKTTRARF